jgi:hypothetical protein
MANESVLKISNGVGTSAATAGGTGSLKSAVARRSSAAPTSFAVGANGRSQISSRPDVVDVPTSPRRKSAAAALRINSYEDEVDGSAPNSPPPSSVAASATLPGPSLSFSHLSFSSVDDDDVDTNRKHHLLDRKVSMTSSTSLPGHVCDFSLVSDPDGPNLRPATPTDTSSLSASSVTVTVSSTASIIGQQAAAGAVKSTFRKNPKQSSKRRETTEVQIADVDDAATVSIADIANVSSLSDDRPAGRSTPRRHTGSLKVKPMHRAEVAAIVGSSKVKDPSVGTSVISLPGRIKLGEGAKIAVIYGLTDELEENTDFEVTPQLHVD